MVQKRQTYDEEKDLGVTFDNKILLFDLYIYTVVNKSSQMNGLIKRKVMYLYKDLFSKPYIQGCGQTSFGIIYIMAM